MTCSSEIPSDCIFYLVQVIFRYKRNESLFPGNCICEKRNYLNAVRDVPIIKGAEKKFGRRTKDLSYSS